MREVDPLVVVVDGDAERALGSLLADDVLAENLVDLLGFGDRALERVVALGEDLAADDLDADAAVETEDQFGDLLAGFTAERAAMFRIEIAGASRGHVGTPGGWIVAAGRALRRVRAPAHADRPRDRRATGCHPLTNLGMRPPVPLVCFVEDQASPWR